MDRHLLMGIDLGGGGPRCLVADMRDAGCTVASRTWSFPQAAHPSGLAYDIDLELAWSLIGEACREAVAKAGAKGEDIAGVAVSAIRCGTVMLDAGGDILFAVPNRDARASPEGAGIAAEFGEAINRETGTWPTAVHLPARLRWLQRERPGLLEMADCVFSLGDWLNFRMCGVRATDHSQAGVTQLYGLATREWNRERMDDLGISPSIFPEVRDSGSKLGTVSAEAAAHIGLSTQTVVGLGGGDSQLSLLGAGALDPGDLGCVAGTTVPVMAVSDEPLADPRGRTWSGHHAVPGLYVLESSAGAMGETLTFMSRLLFPDAPEPELRLLAEAGQSEFGARGMVSTFGADVTDFRNPVLPSGIVALSHLTCADDGTARSHLCRAVVEGHACAIRLNAEVLAGIAGAQPDGVILSAGISRSPVFAQMLADILGLPVTPAGESCTSGLGAAICAGVAAGVYEDFPAAAEALVRNREPVLPDKAAAPAAQRSYAEWLALREAGREGMTHRLGEHFRSTLIGQAMAAGASGTATAPASVSALVTAPFDDASLARLGTSVEVEYASIRETRKVLQGDGLVAALEGKQVFITEADIVDAAAIDGQEDLRLVVACRGNAVNIDVEACSAFGIPVLFTPGRNAAAVADLTVACMLALSRKLTGAAQFLKREDIAAGDQAPLREAYSAFRGHELWDKTIGLVGLGAVGREAASRLRGFGARLIAADPFVTPEAAALAEVQLVGLDDLLEQSDFVSLHVAVTDATRCMIGKEQFARMKKGAMFINTARAQLADEVALLEALEDGTLAGAALDTFLEEPPGFDHPLVQHRNVLSTPHIGGNTAEVARHQGAIVCAAIEKLLRGERPQACLNPEVLEAFDFSSPRPQPSAEVLEALLRKPPPGVSDLQRDRNAGVTHRGVRDVQKGSTKQMNEQAASARDQRQELIDVVNELYQFHIVTATGGNVSVRCDDNPEECWITPSGMFKGDLRPELMVRIGMEGEKRDETAPAPSSEWPFHTQTLVKKPRAMAVIHAHAPYATILANTGLPFLPVSSEAAFFGEIERIPFTMPGTGELAELVSDALKEESVVLMENHGIVVTGTSLRRACDTVQIIERTAEVIVGCYQATGKPPKVLPPDAVALLRSYADYMA
jgi:sugar (pentulose or hexulose) kinase/phosphoglycerate dehydrogenase-like enzyme/ribulose-5-phosphate 4-epimerase/fuculose-1-phosphate aldolase